MRNGTDTVVGSVFGSEPMSRPESLLGRLRAYETNLIEDIVMAVLIFLTISHAWSYAPPAWPQFIYYLALVIGLFGYFKYVSPPPSADDADEGDT